ncbi:hypothetical protein H6F76_05045 [Leptolyngbya sp. FACHB-321]|uniref:hypothetical protein n=1 Tax=Leptolyngbya sp. FACHB-321 TaxID=2692807 RepID=UPI0016836E80|nr:hypothetical protein [Leptolyngbya sp. FACHB-321]MBD2034400.1 hypothetical protein [Leptolyngbya sp. FACHB-321]
MSNFNPNPVDPDPNRVRTSRDVALDNQLIREQNIEMKEQNRAIRENDSAATGLMLGILLFGLAALGFGAYFMTQRPTATPTRTIIQRERTTVTPAQPSPAKPPDVNITVPNPAPPNVNIAVPERAAPAAPAPAAPAPAPAAPAPAAPAPVAPEASTPPTTEAPSDTAPQPSPANP